MRLTFIASRVLIAIAIVAAIVAQLDTTINAANAESDLSQTGPVMANFFSYFTIDSNTLTVGVMLVAALVMVSGVQAEPNGLTLARATVTTFMVITGVVYNLLLRGLPQDHVVGWSNEILHVVGPLYVLVDWFLAPGRARLAPRDVVAVMGFPLLWVTYTLIRGPFATDPFEGTSYWYPYPFLNPVTSTGGYWSVAAYIAAITVLFIGVGLALIWTSRRWGPAATTQPAGIGRTYVAEPGATSADPAVVLTEETDGV
ncbi:MAG: Pr6Pr family membrane protein [Nocardioidaceae bacterium]